jgi:hypothetical protein
MPSLLEVQSLMARVIVARGIADPADLERLGGIVADRGLAPSRRLAIHANNVRHSLVAALAATFPVVRDLVDARFFDYAAATFVESHPMRAPCLAEYGAGFPNFLADFPPCRALPYLADVARFEWAIDRALTAADGCATDPRLLASAVADADGLRLEFLPCYRLLVASWPVDRIHKAHRGPAGMGDLRIAPEAVRLEIWRQDNEVMFRRLDDASFALRRSLADGMTMTASIARAIAIDPLLDIPTELHRIFRLGVLGGFSIASQTMKELH